jgi:(S)-citramalyl-CoA lyase
MYPKALKSGTDMVCIELEDGIAPQDKEIARNLALKLFQEKQENDGVERILELIV